MGYFEENTFYKDNFLSALLSTEAMQELEKKPQPVTNLEPRGMYETLPSYEIIEDDSFFEAFGPFDGDEFQTYLTNVRLFGESIRLELKGII
jgi:hypothetical protein